MKNKAMKRERVDIMNNYESWIDGDISRDKEGEDELKRE